MAAATMSSPNTSPQRPKGLLEVTMRLARSYLAETGSEGRGHGSTKPSGTAVGDALSWATERLGHNLLSWAGGLCLRAAARKSGRRMSMALISYEKGDRG
jgi:hypothetical protein